MAHARLIESLTKSPYVFKHLVCGGERCLALLQILKALPPRQLSGAVAIGAVARLSRRAPQLTRGSVRRSQLGSLVTIAAEAPKNFYHFIFENGKYETSGNQSLPGMGRFSFCQLALAAGYRQASSFDDADALRQALPQIFRTPGPTLIRLRIAPDEPVTPWPDVTMNMQISALRARLGVT